MNRKRYSDLTIRTVLKAAATGREPLHAVLASHGVPERTYHRWRRRWLVPPARLLTRLRELERQNRALRLASQRRAEEILLLRLILGRTLSTVAARRAAVRWIAGQAGVSERRACAIIGISRSSYRYDTAGGRSEDRQDDPQPT